jgi:hypothetical protein
MRVQIRPPHLGAFDVDVRVNMGNWQTGQYVNDPAASQHEDQQGWPVRRMTVSVVNELSEPSRLVGLLVTNASQLSEYEKAFMGVLIDEGIQFDIMDPNMIADKPKLLDSYRLMISNSHGSMQNLSSLDNVEFKDAINSSYDRGLNIVAAGGSGAKIVEILGYGTARSIWWGPARHDSRFISSILLEHPILNDIEPFEDYQKYSVQALETMDHEALLWRVQSGFYPHFVDMHWGEVTPTAYLVETGNTGFHVGAPGKYMPYWRGRSADLVYLDHRFWTRDNNAFAGGYIGKAGRRILSNAVSHYTTVDTQNTFGTTIITHGFQFFTGKWEHYRWPFSMADATANDRQILLLRHGRFYFADLTRDEFQQLDGDEAIDILIQNRFQSCNPACAISRDRPTVIVFDWMEESNLLFQEGHTEAAGDALSALLIDLAGHHPWLLEHLHFIGHSRGAVVNSEAIQRLLFYADRRLLPPGISVDDRIHMTTLDAHPAGHWVPLVPMRDTAVNSFGLGVVGWKAGQHKTAYIDSYFHPAGTLPVGPLQVFRLLYLAECASQPFDCAQLRLIAFRGLDGNPGLDVSGGSVANVDLDAVFGNDEYVLGTHSLVHAWYFGTVDTYASWNEFDTGGLPIFYHTWYESLDNEKSGYNFSRARSGDVEQIQAVESDLVDVLEDLSFSEDLYGRDLRGRSTAGWRGHGGEGSERRMPCSSVLGAGDQLRHNKFYLRPDAGHVRFLARATFASNHTLRILLGNRELAAIPFQDLTAPVWRTVPIPGDLLRSSQTLGFAVERAASQFARLSWHCTACTP